MIRYKPKSPWKSVGSFSISLRQRTCWGASHPTPTMLQQKLTRWNPSSRLRQTVTSNLRTMTGERMGHISHWRYRVLCHQSNLWSNGIYHRITHGYWRGRPLGTKCHPNILWNYLLIAHLRRGSMNLDLMQDMLQASIQCLPQLVKARKRKCTDFSITKDGQSFSLTWGSYVIGGSTVASRATPAITPGGLDQGAEEGGSTFSAQSALPQHLFDAAPRQA